MAGQRDIKAGGAFVELSVRDNLAAGLKKAAAKLKTFGKALTAAGLKLVAVGAAIVAPIAAAAKVFADMGSEIFDASKRLGIAAERLSALKYAAEQSGSSLEDLEAAIRKMSKVLSGVDEGGKSAVDTLKDLGLTIEDLQGLTPDEQFVKIAKALAKVTDATKRASLAQEIFGRGGVSVLAYADEIENLTERARELGIVISGEAAKKADEFGDVLADVAKQVKAIAREIGLFVATYLKPYEKTVTKILKITIDWTKRNGGLAVGIAAVGVAIVGLGVALISIGQISVGLAAVLKIVSLAFSAIFAVLSILSSPITAIIATLGGLTAYFLTSSATGQKALGFLSDKFYQLKGIALDALGGIINALSSGQFALATEILWAGLKLAFVAGTQELQEIWANFRAGFVQTAAAAFYGALEIWAKVEAALKTAWEQTAYVFKRTWAAAVGVVADLFDEVARTWRKAVVEADRITGKITDTQAKKRTAAIDKEIDARKAARRVGEMTGEDKNAAERDKRLKEIEAEKQKTIDEINKAEMDLAKAAQDNAAADKAALVERIAKLRKQLEDLTRRAAGEPKGEGGRDLTLPGDEKPPGPGMPDVEEAIKTISARGTFNAAALQSLQSSPQQERIMKATERTAKNTDRMAAARAQAFS